MSTYPVRLTRELNDDFLMDVMITMVESGGYAVHYWGYVTHVQRREEDSMITEFEVREQEDTDKRLMFTPEVVAKAIDDILNKEYGIAKYIVQYVVDAVALTDAGTIDAEAADVIAQVAMFDEVKYG